MTMDQLINVLVTITLVELMVVLAGSSALVATLLLHWFRFGALDPLLRRMQ